MAMYSNNPAVRGLSFAQMVMGSLFICFGIAQLAAFDHRSSHRTGFGIWGGIWIFLTGLLGYWSVRRSEASDHNNSPTRFIAVFMAFSIISAVIAAIGVIIFAVAIPAFDFCMRTNCQTATGLHWWYWCMRYGVTKFDPSDCRSAKLLGIVTVVQCVGECLVSIISASLCCSAICCGPNCCQPKENRQVVFIPAGEGTVQTQGGLVTDQSGQVQQGHVAMVAPVAGGPPTTQVLQKENAPQVVCIPAEGGVVQMEGGIVIGQSGQVPQTYLAQQVQATTAPQPGHQDPPPAYSGPMASGVTPTQSAEKQPEKNLRVSVEK